jgi:hypothetical protein
MTAFYNSLAILAVISSHTNQPRSTKIIELILMIAVGIWAIFFRGKSPPK